ncbi:MAG: DUF1266 domain-containing protein [Lachnospiraceae bacterium]|nr:DUF1266 domain-containing protein [Lachnospiraceae bacterium]
MKRVSKNLVVVTLSIALAASGLSGCGAVPISNTSDDVSSNAGAVSNDAANTSEDASKEEPDDASGDDVYVGSETDTVQWFNASYAILTYANGQDYNMFGGSEPGMVMEMQYQSMLDSSWGVTDRESADETLDWILTEGHRDDFMITGELLSMMVEECGEDGLADFLMQEYGESQEEADLDVAAYEMYKEYGETAIDGWDYCRALSLLSFYYMAGYYTKEEALDKSLEIAQTVQPLFDSWDGLIDSYLRGYEYWAEADSSERREIYEELLAANDNPFRVDYNITLEKTW